MADYPRIQRGLGNLSPRVFNQIMSQLEDLSNTQAPATGRFPAGAARPFLARLTVAHNLRLLDSYSGEGLGFRWLYDWREVELQWDKSSSDVCVPEGRRVDVVTKLNPDGTFFRTGSVGTTYADCTAAVNLNELFNDSDSRLVGPGFVLGANSEALAIGNAYELTDQVVMIHPFSYPRDQGGTCTETDVFYTFTQDNPLSCDTSTFRSSTFTFDNDLGSDWGVLRDYDVDLGAFN